LVRGELRQEQVCARLDPVAHHLAEPRQLAEQAVDAGRAQVVVIREELPLDEARVAAESAVLIGQIPQADVEQSSVPRHLGEVFVGPELRLHRADACHPAEVPPRGLVM
jgi:hypothetical protein